jgi:HD-GYP domain-containing protein (c-di-GMP phosphodiesterase class II)
MPGERQVWYVEGSPAAAVVRGLRGRYLVQALPAGKRGTSAQWATPQDGAAVVCLADAQRDDVGRLATLFAHYDDARLVTLGATAAKPAGRQRDADRRRPPLASQSVPAVYAALPRRVPREVLATTLAAAFENIELARREREAREELERARREMDELNRIGVALSSTRDINALLNLILLKSREVTNADAGSLYLVEEVSDTERRLRFKLTQNDSVSFPFTESTMPLSENSMAGYVALHGEVINLADAYEIPEERPYQFNPKFDQDSRYRTRSMVTLPMKNAKGEILGVLQLINCKRNWETRLTQPEVVEQEVVPFSAHAVRQALSLASQAAVAYENRTLYEDIETLFEGFVKAAVTAIEQRDPTTSGHSFRVSTLTVGLAETVDRCDTGTYAAVRFTREQMKEIRYAALLHDFGKVGVREEVLVKAKKLYPMQLALVQQRFDYIRKELEARTSERKLRSLLEKSREVALAEVGIHDEEHKRQLAQVDDYFQFILRANEPTVMPEGQFDKLIEIARRTYVDGRGAERNYLTPEEVRYLSIPKGSLDPDERVQIESHVVHTFNFLTQIPWTREIKEIPMIARAHHEKLNGSGYPYQLTRDEIPLQAKMMTIGDIFDALSATDRPYKRAVPVERALEILALSVKDSELDPELYQLFVDAKIFQLTTKR